MPNLENATTFLLCAISNPWAPLGGNNPKKLFPNFKKMNPFWTTYIPRLIFSLSWTRLYKEMSVLNISSSFCCSATQSCPTLCNPMHSRLPCQSLSPRVCSNSCPLSLWCHPTISSPVIPFSSCPQSFLASGSFPMISLGDCNLGISCHWSDSHWDLQPLLLNIWLL